MVSRDPSSWSMYSLDSDIKSSAPQLTKPFVINSYWLENSMVEKAKMWRMDSQWSMPQQLCEIWWNIEGCFVCGFLLGWRLTNISPLLLHMWASKLPTSKWDSVLSLHVTCPTLRSLQPRQSSLRYSKRLVLVKAHTIHSGRWFTYRSLSKTIRHRLFSNLQFPSFTRIRKRTHLYMQQSGTFILLRQGNPGQARSSVIALNRHL